MIDSFFAKPLQIGKKQLFVLTGEFFVSVK